MWRTLPTPPLHRGLPRPSFNSNSLGHSLTHSLICSTGSVAGGKGDRSPQPHAAPPPAHGTAGEKDQVPLSQVSHEQGLCKGLPR